MNLIQVVSLNRKLMLLSASSKTQMELWLGAS